MLVLITSTPVTVTRDKVVENTKDGENQGTTARAGENSENPRSNLVQVWYI